MAKLVKIHKLETKNDFWGADEMLSLSDYTEDYESEDYYKERSEMAKKFVATYEIAIDRIADYENFRQVCYSAIFEYKYSEFRNAEYESEERQAIFEERQKMETFYRSVTFDNWKDGRIDSGMKLGKKLQKEGFPQNVLDYYATQIKTEKTVFFTITDRVQDVIGMSNYAKMGSWQGYNGTSCQDTRHDASYNICLIGAIADNNLLIGQLHYELEDLGDMQDKLKARILMRAWQIDYNGKTHSICKGVKAYGNDSTKSELMACLECLDNEGIGVTKYL